MLKNYLKTWMGVCCIIFLCTVQWSLAQNNGVTILKTTKIADFGVDADINSGILSFSESDGSNTDDWFEGINGGYGVINTLNQTTSDSLNAGFNIKAEFRMSQTVNPNWLDAVYLRDYYSHNNEKDNTIFGGGDDKNYDDPTTWTIKKGSVPPKNDIIDVYGHLRTDSNLTDLWVFGAVSTRTQNGDNYIDFEYFRKPIELNPDSQNLISQGEQNGHTAYKFNLENGSVIIDGDVILSVNYINGGSLAEFRFYAWIDADEIKGLDGDPSSLSDADFIYYNINSTGKRFDFGYGTVAGDYENYIYDFYNCNNDPNIPYGYARISLISNVTVNPIFAQDNTVDDVQAPTWGTIGPDGSVSNSYVSPSFIEFALNTSLLGLDSNSTSGNCSGPLGHVLVKSRASASFTSELKDLAGPFTLGANSKNTISISNPEVLTCSVTEITLTAITSADNVSNYKWFKDNVSFDDLTPGDNSLTVNEPGNYYVKISFSEGCEIISNEVEVIQNSIEPNVTALGGDITCSIGQIQLNGTISSTNPNANLKFEWTGPNNFVNSTELNPFVTLEGTYTLTVTDIDNSCTSFASAEVTSESVAPLEIQCPPAVEVQCRDDVPEPDVNTVIIISGGNLTVQFVSDVSDNGSCPEIITRTYSGTDGCNNVVYCTQIITVIDTVGPEIVDVADHQLEGCNVEWPEYLATTWTDNCSTGGSIGSDAGVDKDSSADGSIEYREYTFTVKDACDNTATETTVVSRIIDSVPPEIQCPPAVEVQCRDDVPEPDVNTVIIISGGNLTVQFVSDVSDNGSCPEIITRTYSGTDGCNNVVYCTQIITVIDTVGPEIVDVADHQLEVCNVEWPEYLATTWTDNCSTGGSIGSDAGVDKGSSSDGSIEYREYTFTVKDACDNTATETTVVSRIIDSAPPEIQCPPTINVQCRDDVPEPDVNTVIIINGENLTVQFVSDVSDNGSCPEIITRTYSATDGCNNVVYCTQVITVNDTIDPEIVDVADHQLEGCNVEWPEFLTTTWSDNCSIGGSINSDSGVDKGSSADGSIEYREYTFTVSDNCGNLDTETTQVSRINGSAPPEIQCPPAIEVQCKDDVPGPDISTVIIINGENLTVQFVSDVSDNGSCPETITRTYSATDGCGNIVYCTQIIAVNDTVGPEIVDVADYQLEGCAAEWPEFLTTTWSDNCSTGGNIDSDAGVDKGSSSDGSIEYREYTFTVKDACGNTATETTVVSRLVSNGEIIDGNDIELILGYGEFDLFELLPEDYIPGGIWILYSTNPNGLEIEVSNSGSIFISNELLVGDYVFHYTIDCTVIKVTVYLIPPAPPPCDDGEKVIGDSIELCRDFGEYDLSLLLPEEYNISGGTWMLYLTEPEGLNIVISDSGFIYVSNEIAPGIYVFHYILECKFIEVNVKILEDINCVEDCEGGEISTALTPNGDSVNDTFYAGVDPGGSCTVDVQIFNRWGNKIFEAQNYQNDWNGAVNSKAIGSAGKITTGTYYYILRYKTDGEIEQTITGYFYVATE